MVIEKKTQLPEYNSYGIQIWMNGFFFEYRLFEAVIWHGGHNLRKLQSSKELHNEKFAQNERKAATFKHLCAQQKALIKFNNNHSHASYHSYHTNQVPQFDAR